MCVVQCDTAARNKSHSFRNYTIDRRVSMIVTAALSTHISKRAPSGYLYNFSIYHNNTVAYVKRRVSEYFLM